jgi:hypothetical protein
MPENFDLTKNINQKKNKAIGKKEDDSSIIRSEDIFDDIKNKEDEYLENIPWDYMAKSIEYRNDLFEKAKAERKKMSIELKYNPDNFNEAVKNAIEEIRFAHQDLDSIGFYYETSLKSEKFSSSIPKIQNVKYAFQEYILEWLKEDRADKEKSRTSIEVLPYHLVQLEALYFNDPQNFKNNVMTIENKELFVSFINDIVEFYYKKIEEAKEYGKKFELSKKFFAVSETVSNLHMYRIILTGKDQTIETFVDKEIERMKDITLEYLQEVKNSKKDEESKNSTIRRIYATLLELKLLNPKIIDFNEDFANKIKLYIKESIELSNNKNTFQPDSEARWTLFFIGTINDIIREQKNSNNN